jgi:hypothetical protein
MEVTTPEVYEGMVSKQNVFPGYKEGVKLCTLKNTSSIAQFTKEF